MDRRTVGSTAPAQVRDYDRDMIKSFDNRFFSELPADPIRENSLRQVQGAAYSHAQPTPVSAPRLLAWTPEVAAAIGLSVGDVESAEFLAAFSGNALLPGMQPYAVAYGGHQFGHWAGQLGDGRAISLGEVIGADGKRHELQLKGAGPTPYSRRADGRAVLRSSLREYVCSESMHHLGIPTTRALSLMATGDSVVRDMFYDGNPRAEPGAIVCRVAPSFLRFGNYELPTSRGDQLLLEKLVDFTLDRDFPHLQGSPLERRSAWFSEVAERTAFMVAHWMRVGFVHGVMNTDNLSILGLTIDYGPYGWLESFDPDWTPNTTDAQGRRYAYARQPQIAHWNLSALAGALTPLFPDQAPLHAGLERYAEVFEAEHARMTFQKFGLLDGMPDDLLLARDFFALLQAAEMDMSIAFRALADLDLSRPGVDCLSDAFYDHTKRAAHESDFHAWLQRYAARLAQQAEAPAPRRERMNAVNPRFVPRNYLAQQAIDKAEKGDLAELHTLIQVLKNPYQDQPGFERFAGKRPEWARERAGCSMLSCSS